MKTFENINYCWGNLIVEELIRQGVDYFCIAPGSRSSPIAVSIARNKKSKTFVHFDERGLAFHALGYAAATGKAAVLVCTSGTAGANFLPAVIEASKKKLPLIVITADRPPELRQTGAVQTIDQVGIFGKYVAWAVDMPCPDLDIKPEFVLTTVDQAVSKNAVVHINCMFREPLAPTVVKNDWATYLKSLTKWFNSNAPYTQYLKAKGRLDRAQLEQVADLIDGVKNGIIVVGKIDPKAKPAVLALAKRLGWPVFADIASGLRLGAKDQHVITYFDQILLNAPKTEIDGVLHLGGRITSKRYYEFIQAQAPEHYVMVINHGLRSDPNHQVSLRLESSVQDFCKNIAVKVRRPSLLLNHLILMNTKIDQAIDQFLSDDTRINEPKVARQVSQLLPKGSGLYLSNSMPIRDMDMYADHKGKDVTVCGNRGASGIDGLIASSIGFAQGLQAPVTLMIGDIAALHDLNSLAMLRDVDYPLVIIVINNGGGAIFSFLPIAEQKDIFEKYYGTPHAFTFANAASMFELQYAQSQSTTAFKNVYMKAIKSKTATIIEVITSRPENFKMHQVLQSYLHRKS